jgi:hypothetical protein
VSGVLKSRKEAAMTQDERRIVEHLMTTIATELEDLPDWILGILEKGDGEEPSRELITAVSLMLVRRERPGIGFGAARRVLAGYVSDPARYDELAAKIQAYRLSCSFKRLKWAGLYEEVAMGDPIDPDGEVSVRLTKTDWEFFNSNPTKREVHMHLQGRLGLRLYRLEAGRFASRLQARPKRQSCHIPTRWS